MFSLLVSVKNVSYFPYIFIQVQAFKKDNIVSIYLLFYFQPFGNTSNKFQWDTNTYTYSIRWSDSLLAY